MQRAQPADCADFCTQCSFVLLLGKLMCTVKAGMMRKWFEGGEESNKVYCTDASLCVHVCVHVVPHLASP